MLLLAPALVLAAYVFAAVVPLLPHTYLYDNGMHLALGRALYHGRVDIEYFGIDTATGPDGRFYSPRAPAIGALVALGITITDNEDTARRAVPALACFALIIVLWLSAGVGLAAAALLALAPPLVYYVHGLSEVYLSAALILLAATCRSERVAGLAAGFIAFADYRLVPMTLLAFTSRAMILPALVGWGVLGLYHTMAFGAPWRLAQHYVTAFPWSNNLVGMYGWWPPWRGAGDIFLGVKIDEWMRNQVEEPAYGMLIVAPWLVLAPLGWIRVRSRRLALALGLSIAVAALTCTHRTGLPRYLAPLVPLWMAPILMSVWQRTPTSRIDET